MDEDEDFGTYYDHDGEEIEMERKKEDDPEYFEYDLLRVEDVERLLNESVEAVCKAINVSDYNKKQSGHWSVQARIIMIIL